jgi:K+-transporting ATPase KdpF subunit
MVFLTWLGGVLAVFLVGYLFVALLKPEWL